MTDNPSWTQVAATWFLALVAMILLAWLNSCINVDKRAECEAEGGQYIQNRDSDLSSCVMPRRWN